ncbi:SDR family oxidoreductase [Temperatibacter marinus]|uniref:SDR family oxidoreductase n=1 Tax=Temperatibacter marinus TaxID=1456591 RepID=A0AA52EEP2_9PROT|nr:SDR family oxidoreductase [Temperatibacter marinus]WND04127.1 SDR family oxidoreductase [Temperatibacter marinus]
MTDWTEHKIIVTGGSSGLGAETVSLAAAKGAAVHFCGLEADCPIDLKHNSSVYHQCDVRDERAVAVFIESAVDEMGGLTGAVNAAAISHHAHKLADIRPAMVEDVWRTNVMGVWFAMRHQIKAMLPLGGGAIVNVASILSNEPAQWMAAYGMSKYAVAGMSETAALDYRDNGIRINAVSPGPVRTPMLERALEDVGGDLSKFAGGFPEGGPAEPHVIADIFLRLIGDEKFSVTGENILLNGDGSLRREDIKTIG